MIYEMKKEYDKTLIIIWKKSFFWVKILIRFNFFLFFGIFYYYYYFNLNKIINNKRIQVTNNKQLGQVNFKKLFYFLKEKGSTRTTKLKNK